MFFITFLMFFLNILWLVLFNLQCICLFLLDLFILIFLLMGLLQVFCLYLFLLFLLFFLLICFQFFHMLLCILLLTHCSFTFKILQTKFIIQNVQSLINNTIYQFRILQQFLHLNIILFHWPNMGKVIFPSRPKPTPENNNHQNRSFDKQRQKQKKLFNDTIKDMRTMVQKHYGSYTKDTLGMTKHNTKVPYTHLMGRRNKIAQRYSHQKARAKEENIQYDSSLQLLNSNIVEQSKRQKDQFDKNKYKFQGEHLNEGRLGRQSDGMLTLSKKDIRRINGKQFDPKQNKKNKHQNPHQQNSKRKKISKAKKGGKKRH